MPTVQEQLDAACGRLHRAADNLCRLIGTQAAQPTDAEIDNLVAGIDARTVEAMALTGPRTANAAAKRPTGKKKKRRVT